MNTFLAFDLGASSGRAILGTLTDRIQIRELHRFANEPYENKGHLRWQISHLFNEMKRGLQIASSETGGQLDGIGVDTWGVDFGLLGRDRSLLDDPVTYRDRRTEGVMERTFHRLSREKIYQLTGIQFMPFNTLFQVVSIQESDPHLLEKAQRLLFMPDLFHFFLTGKEISEYTIASTSQFLDAGTRTWASEIYLQLDLSTEIMAPLIEPGTVIGPLLESLEREAGLSATEIIAPASHDTASAVAAVPATDSNWAYLSSGTWSLVGIELDEPIINEKALSSNFTNEGGVNRTIRFLRNVAGFWLLESCKKKWEEEEGPIDYDSLMAKAMNTESFISFIDPDHETFLNPDDMSKAIRQFCKATDQPDPEDQGAMVRCILESLALKYRNVKEKIEGLRKKPIEVLHIVGGGSQNHLLNQWTANATGCPVIAGPKEATAIGNILVQAMGKGLIGSLQEGRELVSRSFSLTRFEPQDEAKWDAAYERIHPLLS
jgi:rhamnulokinase